MYFKGERSLLKGFVWLASSKRFVCAKSVDTPITYSVRTTWLILPFLFSPDLRGHGVNTSDLLLWSSSHSWSIFWFLAVPKKLLSEGTASREKVWNYLVGDTCQIY